MHFWGPTAAININDDWGPKLKKLVVDIDEVKARRAGLTNQDIALSLQTALSGFETGDWIGMRQDKNLSNWAHRHYFVRSNKRTRCERIFSA